MKAGKWDTNFRKKSSIDTSLTGKKGLNTLQMLQEKFARNYANETGEATPAETCRQHHFGLHKRAEQGKTAKSIRNSFQ